MSRRTLSSTPERPIERGLGKGAEADEPEAEEEDEEKGEEEEEEEDDDDDEDEAATALAAAPPFPLKKSLFIPFGHSNSQLAAMCNECESGCPNLQEPRRRKRRLRV